LHLVPDGERYALDRLARRTVGVSRSDVKADWLDLAAAAASAHDDAAVKSTRVPIRLVFDTL
jgi:hypothetical protein